MMQILPYGSYSDPGYYGILGQQFNPNAGGLYNSGFDLNYPGLNGGIQYPFSVIQGAFPGYQYANLNQAQVPLMSFVPNYVANVAAFPVSSGARVYPTASAYRRSTINRKQPMLGWGRI